MSDQDLEKKWKEMVQETFDKFIEKNFAGPKEAPPSCYGTGDDKDWCIFCKYRDGC